MKWFSEHKLFSIIVGIVVALCLVIVISYTTAGGNTVVGRGVQQVVSTVQKPLSVVTGTVRDTISGLISFKKIQRENERLKKENEALRNENKDLRLTSQELSQLEKLSAAFNYEPYKSGGKAVAGNIIAIDMSKPYIVFTINAGTEKGIKKGDVVVDGNGLVGKINQAGSGWAKVISVLSDGNNISFKTLRDPKITGVLAGDGKDRLEGYLMGENSRIMKGDTLITTGIGVYPMGIEIGKVKKVAYDENRQLKTVEVTPSVNFKNMQKVAVFI